MLYMANPLSAAELSRQSGSGTSWMIGGSSSENLCIEGHDHRSLDEAPPGPALDIARRIDAALDGAILPASESDTLGRVVLVECDGSSFDEDLPSKRTLLDALGMKRTVSDRINLHDEATLETVNLENRDVWLGFEDDQITQEQPEEDDSDVVKAKRVTDIMVADLTGHFELNFSENIVCAPVLYGGMASGGNIVCVLSMRVWT